MNTARMFAMALALASCGGGSSDTPADSTPRVLASLENLTPTEASEDTFSEHRPAEIDCNNVGGYYLEDGSLEVDTGSCNYLSLAEPALLDLEAGTLVETEISYFDLTAPEPTEAHLALAIGGRVVWETTLAIPSDGQVLELSVPLELAVKKGDLVEFHLHNHGQNTWNFSPLLVP